MKIKRKTEHQRDIFLTQILSHNLDFFYTVKCIVHIKSYLVFPVANLCQESFRDTEGNTTPSRKEKIFHSYLDRFIITTSEERTLLE